MADDLHNAILKAAARETFRPMGLRQKGRSRTWLDDRGWWVLVVELQPSGFGKASYLNVGICWMWSAEPKDYLSFDLGYRVPRAGGSFESEAQWRAVVDDLMQVAAGEVERYRGLVPDLAAAARECVTHEEARIADLRARDGTDMVPAGWPTWHAAVSSGLAGDIDRAVHYFDAATRIGLTSGSEFFVPVRRLASEWMRLVADDHAAYLEDVRRHAGAQRRALRLHEDFSA